MTKNQFRKKCRELKRDVSKLIDAKIEKILESGCLNLEDYDNDYRLPKAFMTAIGNEINFQFKPRTKELLETSKNIELFL